MKWREIEIKWPVSTLALLAVLVVGIRMELTRCEKLENTGYTVTSGAVVGATYYWHYVHLRQRHGICAAMYSNEDQSRWELDVPSRNEPTASYYFDTKAQAEAYGDKRCFAWDRNWLVLR